MLRRQIGTETTYDATPSATTIPFSARAIKRGSLVVVMWTHDAAQTGHTYSTSDDAGGKWTTIVRTGDGSSNDMTCGVSYSWNHPGGSSVSVTVSFGGITVKPYRVGAIFEFEGPDFSDPLIDLKTTTTDASDVLPVWLQAPPGSHGLGIIAAYNVISSEAVYAGTSFVYTNDYTLITKQPLPGGTSFHRVSGTTGSGNIMFNLAVSFRGSYNARHRINTASVATPSFKAAWARRPSQIIGGR